MKKNDPPQNFFQRSSACVLAIVSLALSCDGNAATATATASATVLESVSVSFNETPSPMPAEVETMSVLSGTVFTLKSFTGSLSRSGPLLRFGPNPPPGFRGASVSPAVNGAAVTVTRNADGSMSVSGGSGLTFAVSQLGAGPISIEYN